MVPSERSCHKEVRNTHVQYEIPIHNGLKVMAKVKVFVYATNVDVDINANTWAMTKALRTFVLAR